jgi:hypothetical protein
MNIYRDTNTEVVFEHPHPGPLTADVYRQDVEDPILTVTGIASVGGRYTLPLTYIETQYDGELRVVWSAASFERTQLVDVRNPLVPLSRIRTLFDDNKSDAELAELENSVRLIIEAYTRQDFGYELGNKYIAGTGQSRLILPSKLHRLEAIIGGPVGYFHVSPDGWAIQITNKNYLTTKEVPPEEFADNKIWTGDGLSGGVIYVPDTYWNQFRTGITYTVEGEWGYPTVPDAVQEAALLLANDLACGESIYRDRYLKTLKAGDWNMSFKDAAFRGTGNARADELLEEFRRGMSVVVI